MTGLGIVDTSFLVAIMNPEDRFHAAALVQAERQRDLLIPAEAWTETMGLVLRRHGFAASLNLQASIESQARIRVVHSAEREHRLAWRIYVEQAGRLSLTDALVVAWARLEGADVVTFDANQARAASG
jgi:predicted nucleic acid-binding protein